MDAKTNRTEYSDAEVAYSIAVKEYSVSLANVIGLMAMFPELASGYHGSWGGRHEKYDRPGTRVVCSNGIQSGLRHA